VLKLVIESDEFETCRNCGAHVSTDFRRVFGDSDDIAHRCRECDTSRRLSRGSAAGSEVAVADPETSSAHRSSGRSPARTILSPRIVSPLRP
jgi:hypothetical protein